MSVELLILCAAAQNGTHNENGNATEAEAGDGEESAEAASKKKNKKKSKGWFNGFLTLAQEQHKTKSGSEIESLSTCKPLYSSGQIHMTLRLNAGLP